MFQFSEQVQSLFDKFKEAAKFANDYPIVIGGFIRDHYYYGESSGDVDVVLKNGNNLQFVNFLERSYGASNVNIFDNTGTLHFSLDGFEVEIQSSTNPLVHFDIRKELKKMGLPRSWTNNNVYERDFTINTLYYDIMKNKVVDKTKMGISDLLENKLIRCPINPLVALNNNPIIIIRAIKFAIQFGLEIDGDFINKAPMFKSKFIGRINYRNNRHYLKGYIKESFDMDFEKAYNYYNDIDFLDILPLGEELQEDLNKRRMGIIYRKPTNMVRNLKNFITKVVEKDGMMSNSAIKIHHNKEENKLIFNFATSQIGSKHKLIFQDLVNKGIMGSDTQLVFLDNADSPVKFSSISDDGLTVEAIEINQHLYDTIKGKQEYRQRKKKEDKKKTVDMWNTLEQVKQMVGEDNGPKKELKKQPKPKFSR